MIVEVEIDEALARRWSSPFGVYSSEDVQIDEALIKERLAHLVQRYGTFPEQAGPRHLTAIALVRARAMEHAVAFGGGKGRDVESIADDILEYMLGGR